jgi:hypothetical protein
MTRLRRTFCQDPALFGILCDADYKIAKMRRYPIHMAAWQARKRARSTIVKRSALAGFYKYLTASSFKADYERH